MTRHPKLSESLRLRRGRLLGRATRRALGLSVTGKRLVRRSRTARRGSTLLVVVALLGMLSLLGLLFFTFATQEQANATFFAEAAKRIDAPGDDIDAIFEEAIKQLALGADNTKQNSVLSYQHSLIGTMFGKDLQPFSGTASNFTYVDNGAGRMMELVVDQNGDGVIDFDSMTNASTAQPGNYLLNPLEPNGSAAAQPDLRQRPFTLLPAPDVDYTYPDIANMFLAQKTFVWDPSTGTRKLILKPSFHRPELLRDNMGQPIGDWATKIATPADTTKPFSTRGRLLRPHPEHLYVWRPTQNTSLTPERRFLDDYNPTDAGVIAGLSCQRGFPFHKVPPLPAAVPAVAVPRLQGIWSQAGFGVAMPVYEYDVDNDEGGTGTPEGIWLDLDLGILVRPSDNKTYVPMISFTAYDLDSLINLNTSGNLSGEDITKANPTVNFGTTSDITRSAMGLGPNEVNPSHALDAVPGPVIVAGNGVDVAAASLTDHNSYFGHLPANQRELANMELWWMLTGRVEYTTPNKITAGRHGEANRLWNVLSVAAGGPAIGVNVTQSDLFPFAGYTYADEANKKGGDDNRDENEGRESWLGLSAVGQTQPFVHPLLLQGRGRFWGTAGNFKNLRMVDGGLIGNPIRFLGYDGAGVGAEPNTGNANALWYNTGLTTNPMVNTLIGANYKNQNASLGANERLVHDELETSLEPKYSQRPYDETFESIESLWLQMGNGDRTRSGIESRLSKLMPGNFQGSSTATYQFEISQRFTTESWDLKAPGMPRLIGGVGADGGAGIAQADDNGNGVVDEPEELGWPGSDDDRAWEFNVDFDGDGNLEFPPQFNPTTNRQPQVFDTTSPSYRPENAFGPQDPFRPQLRRLLSAEYGDTKEIRRPTRLSINEFLDVERRQGVAGNDYTSPLQYRALTPHSVIDSANPLPNTTVATANGPFQPTYNLPAYPPTTEEEKEYWARRDRQQMARDIYVLLYTFCGGGNTMNVTSQTTGNGGLAYPVSGNQDIRRQMAQFAVNMVDALDRDNCITAFEYDRDLSNGWGLDDDPYGPASNDVTVGLERDVVFGVEAAELTISEVLWIRQEGGQASNFNETPFNEMGAEANFLQIELRSLAGTYDSTASAFRVPLATTASTIANRGLWRILRDDNTHNGIVDGTENAFELLAGVGGTVAPGDKMTPGSLFTIATSNTPIGGSAALYIDSSGATSDFELVAPNKGPTFLYTGAPIPAGQVAPDLDMQHSSHTGRFALTNGVPGDFLSPAYLPASNTTRIALQRRLNPYRPQIPIGQNPYVTVDEFSGVTRRELKFQGDSTLMPPLPAVASQSDASMRLGYTAPFNAPLYPLASQERRQPLNGNGVADGTSATGPSPHWNTLSLNNQNAPAGGAFNLFQPHFDRDFSSTLDLFHVFITGPARLTSSVLPSRQSPYATFPVTFGQAVVLQTEDRDGSGGAPVGAEDLNGDGVLYSNHYHRLLSLVEVPTRTHRQLGNPLQVNRVPGKINLNNVRDRHVLAALIDERQAITTEEDTNRNGVIDAGEQLNGSTDGVLGLADATGDTGRDWWKSFLESRERLDPITRLPLPITGYSLPFRDSANAAATRRYGYAQTGVPAIPDTSPVVPSVDHTIMRRLPIASSASGRGLLDLANEAEFDGSSPVTDPPIDPVIRQRLLAKIYGNTTTRSNCFVVFATIGMFECVELPTGAVRIGGQMDVDNDGTPDAHRAIFIIDRSEALDAYDQGSGTFDWKKLIKARQRIN